MIHEPLAGEIISHHFRTSFDALARISLQVSTVRGHRARYRTNGEKIARAHLQLSDALRALMQGNRTSRRIPHSIAAEQLADLVLRVMEFGLDNKLDIAGALIAKLDHNAAEPQVPAEPTTTQPS